MSEVIFPLDQSELSFTASGGSTVRRSILPSGVRVLTEHMPGAQSASVSFTVAVGSRDETNGHFGSTHFLEHLLFKGTTRRTALDIAVAFDSVGGSSNASTGKEHTSYYARVQDKALPVAVDVIADMLTSSLIDPTEFENERPVILEELAMNDDDPQDVVHEIFAEAVLGDHALGRPIGGTKETISAVTREAVWEHYKANYRPQDLVVVAAGGVDHNALVGLVEKGLTDAGWNLGEANAPVERRLMSQAEIKRGTDLKVIHRPIQQANVIVGMQGLISDDPRRYAMGVLNTVLGGPSNAPRVGTQPVFDALGFGQSAQGLVSVFSFWIVFAQKVQPLLEAPSLVAWRNVLRNVAPKNAQMRQHLLPAQRGALLPGIEGLNGQAQTRVGHDATPEHQVKTARLCSGL